MKRILVAEDDRATHRLLQSLLSKWGYEVISAFDGYEALDKLKEDNPPHLLLLDRIMPGLDGDEVCRRIREAGKPTPAHVIYLTVKDSKEDVVDGLDEGANDYITKPFHEKELRARVDVGRRLVELQLQLQKSVEEKEMLLREVHHRVKNNLNIILSLIGLEESNPGKSAQEVLSELKHRIHSIYGVHEKLFAQDQFTNVNFRDYLDDLIVNIFNSFDSEAAGIRCSLDIEGLELDVAMVVPLGLIVTELVTNSLKYAFPENRGGNISVGLRKEGGEILLQVGDNGISLPQEIDFARAATLGLRLVRSLAEQLQGEMSISRDGGTLFTFRFSYDKQEEK